MRGQVKELLGYKCSQSNQAPKMISVITGENWCFVFTPAIVQPDGIAMRNVFRFRLITTAASYPHYRSFIGQLSFSVKCEEIEEFPSFEKYCENQCVSYLFCFSSSVSFLFLSAKPSKAATQGTQSSPT